MSKLVTAFLFLFVGISVLSGIMAGGGGIVTTQLTSAITAASVVIPVTSTVGFPTNDYIIIGNEKILYAAHNVAHTQFITLTRTAPVPHANGGMVYTGESSTLNNALGFNVAATTDTMGIWAAATIPFLFLTKTLPRIISINWNFLGTDMAILAYFFFAVGAGLLITLALSLAGGRRMS